MIIKNKNGIVIFDGDAANLRGADLSDANLRWADLSGANLSEADLRWADLRGADLRGANLSWANLSGANLSWADLSGAYLSGAYLSGANLSRANLSGANLSLANLSGSNLSGANLSGATGISSQTEILKQNFKTRRGKLVVYKAFGKTTYSAPATWRIEPGAIIEEIANWNRSDECGCGANFGTLEFVVDNYKGQPVWECEIGGLDLAGIVVPLNFDGKARCSRLKLIRQLSPEEIEERLAK